MHEFALGTTSAISHFGPVHNPWDLERIAGGSSGGDGAAVAASLCFGAVGTDTGGSNRIPATCRGVVGLKPTYGVVGTRGVIGLHFVRSRGPNVPHRGGHGVDVPRNDGGSRRDGLSARCTAIGLEPPRPV